MERRLWKEEYSYGGILGEEEYGRDQTFEDVEYTIFYLISNRVEVLQEDDSQLIWQNVQ